MKQFSAAILNLLITFPFAGLIIFPAYTQAQDLFINDNITISAIDPPEEVDNVFYNNSSKLTITGTLIVNNDFYIDQNNASLELGEGARLIVYGNFIANNKVNITLQKDSYLFVFGDFSKGGAPNQDVIIIDNAKIYILGNGNNWGENLTSCSGTYNGTTSNVNDTCDFGNEEAYENNQDEFPDDLIEQLNCYDLSDISDQPVCEGAMATFTVSSIPDVKYEWQEKNGDADWITVGSDSNIYTTLNTSIEDNGKLYRVIVRPTGNNPSCNISISRKVSLSVQPWGIWKGEVDTNWNNKNNWSCNTLPTLETNVIIPENLVSGNYPLVSAGNNALAKDLIIETGAIVTVTDNWLRIAGVVQNSGSFNAVTGSISFEGTAAQSIPSETFDNNQIENLQIYNTSGVTLEGTLEITGILKITSGAFNTGNSLTLISSAEKTALIDGSGIGEVTGTVTMQRYLDPAYGYKYFSSPFSETKAGDFTDIDFTADFPNFYRYDENRSLVLGENRNDATGWEAITDPISTLNNMEGYALNFGANNNPTLVELTGVVNNGSYTRVLENNNREYTRGFHLIGNPYPSPIDWNSNEGWDKTNIEDGIYFFTAGETQYTGTYTSYINGISSTDGKSSGIIPSMQGFFVKVTDPAEGVSKVTGSLGITNKARVTDFAQEFLKTREQEEKPLLRLTAAFEGAGNKDAMVVYFSANYGTKFNKGTDAHKLMNTDASVPNLYSLSEDNINLSINALPFPGLGSYEKIPLGIKAENSGRMHIELADLQKIPSNWNIYLIDKEKRIGQDLRKKSSYSFSIKEGEHHERFQLLFSKEKISDPAIAFDEKFSVESRDFIKVKLNLEEGEKGEIRISTLTGQLLEVKEGRGKEQVEFSSITSSGIYFINLYVNDQRYSKKVLVNK